MTIDIKKCDINNDFFHFTNKDNINSILKNGLVVAYGTASALVEDEPNVSISKGGKGIMGIINAFIYKFEYELTTNEIPVSYRKYFMEIPTFYAKKRISRDNACKAMKRKLADEVYFRVRPTEEQLQKAKIGGLTGYDVKLPDKIYNDQLELVTDSDNNVISAYDVAKYVYDKAKDKKIFRKVHEDFFYMFEMNQQQNNQEEEEER